MAPRRRRPPHSRRTVVLIRLVGVLVAALFPLLLVPGTASACAQVNNAAAPQSDPTGGCSNASAVGDAAAVGAVAVAATAAMSAPSGTGDPSISVDDYLDSAADSTPADASVPEPEAATPTSAETAIPPPAEAGGDPSSRAARARAIQAQLPPDLKARIWSELADVTSVHHVSAGGPKDRGFSGCRRKVIAGTYTFGDLDSVVLVTHPGRRRPLSHT